MKIRYNLDVQDWVSFQQFFRGKKAPLNNLATPLIIFCSVFMLVLNVFYIHYEGLNLMSFISGIILIILLYLLYVKVRSGKQLQDAGNKLKKKHPEVFGEMAVEFNNTGIYIQSTASSQSLAWNDMDSFDENKSYFFMYSKKGMAYIIPKRDLDVETVNKLREFLQNCRA